MTENLAKKWIATAKKYIPDLNKKQEDLIIAMTKCPKYNGSFPKISLATGKEEHCSCSLCMLILIWDLKNKESK